MHTLNDRTAELVALAKQGDQSAYEKAIFYPYERQIYSFIFRMMGDADDAYDLTQDCFVKAYTALGRTREDLNVSAWLHRIASNACLDVLRRRQRLRWLPWEASKHEHLLPASRLDEPEDAAERAETCATVRLTLARLSGRDRAALLMREYEDMSCADIGAALGISRSATKSLLFRSRERFRAAWAAVEAERLRGAA